MSYNDLANDLLDDLNDSSSDEQQQPTTTTLIKPDPDAMSDAEEADQEDEEKPTIDSEMEFLPSGGVRPTVELDVEEVEEMQLGGVQDIAKVAKLFGSKSMKEVLKKIDYYAVNPDENLASDGESAEYQLIVQANNLSVEIDNEMLIVHKFIRDHYLHRFPELDSLVSIPLQFCHVILALGNGETLAGDLTGLVQSGAAMAVHVTAATTKGVMLDAREWNVVEGGCRTMFGLEEAKRKILEYVESRISMLAPNISAIVGTTTATKILGIAGGLHGLSRIPHSNIYVLGQIKRANTAFSTGSHSTERKHTGFVYQCPLVQRTRIEDRMKAQRKVGAKIALAVRVDISGSRPDGSFGEEMVEKLLKEMERLAAPNPTKLTKALPRPDEKRKSKRGGARARKAKEAYAMTDLSKQQNRMAFGQVEEEVGAYDETRGMGMIGSSSGKVRAGAADARTKIKISKAAQNRLTSLKSSGSGLATSGLATSLSFTPHQGIELIDPGKARAKIAEADSKWFGNSGTFTHVAKGGGIGKPSV